MEEPELTLVSTSDISIAETDFANLTLEEKSENEAKNSFRVNLISIPFYPIMSKPVDCLLQFIRRYSLEGIMLWI